MKLISMAAIIVAALTAASVSASPAASRSLPPNNSVLTHAADAAANRVVVLRVESLGSGSARAVVIRRPTGKSTQDFILVIASTSPADLAKAVATLMFSRRTHGPQVTSELRAEISPAAASTGLRSKDSQRATRDLARLAQARVVSIKGVGHGPAIGIATANVAARQKK